MGAITARLGVCERAHFFSKPKNMIPNTEGLVCASARGDGSCVHKCTHSGFFTLHAVRTTTEQLPEMCLVVRVGARDVTLCVDVPKLQTSVVLSNLYVYAGEEVWVTATESCPVMVYGTFC